MKGKDSDIRHIKKTTSIGHSKLSKPKNKSKKLAWKPYRGQGKP